MLDCKKLKLEAFQIGDKIFVADEGRTLREIWTKRKMNEKEMEAYWKYVDELLHKEEEEKAARTQQLMELI